MESQVIGMETTPKARPSFDCIRFRQPDRSQMRMVTMSLDDLVPPEHHVRMVWAVVERLDLSRFAADLAVCVGEAGRPATDVQEHRGRSPIISSSNSHCPACLAFPFVAFALFVVPIVRTGLAFGSLRIDPPPRSSRRARRSEEGAVIGTVPIKPEEPRPPLHCVTASLRENNIQTVFFKSVSRRGAVTQGKNGEDRGRNWNTADVHLLSAARIVTARLAWHFPSWPSRSSWCPS